jgi:hypothetical protein
VKPINNTALSTNTEIIKKHLFNASGMSFAKPSATNIRIDPSKITSTNPEDFIESPGFLEDSYEGSGDGSEDSDKKP